MKQIMKFEHQLIEKAMKDPKFRKQLLENPKAVIEIETGAALPATVNLRILEEDLQTTYLVLPEIQAQRDIAELTESELEMTSGGTVDTVVTAELCTRTCTMLLCNG